MTKGVDTGLLYQGTFQSVDADRSGAIERHELKDAVLK
jgi:Ca2+-binding EF-hand superfamily protein